MGAPAQHAKIHGSSEAQKKNKEDKYKKNKKKGPFWS
jgi:hypothetical protein